MGKTHDTFDVSAVQRFAVFERTVRRMITARVSAESIGAYALAKMPARPQLEGVAAAFEHDPSIDGKAPSELPFEVRRFRLALATRNPERISRALPALVQWVRMETPAAYGPGGPRPTPLAAHVERQLAPAIALHVRTALGFMSEESPGASGARAVGLQLYAAFGERPPRTWLSRAPCVVAPCALPAETTLESKLAPVADELRLLVADRAAYQVLGSDYALMRWTETRVPAGSQIVGLANLRVRLADLQHLELAVGRLAAGERAYALTIGPDGPSEPIQRPPIQDVAAVALYERIRLGTDPFDACRHLQRAATSLDWRRLAQVAEIAILRRLDAATHDVVRTTDGEERRPSGWDIDPRHAKRLHDAFDAGELGKEMRRLTSQLGEHDPELRRIAHVAGRLIEADLLIEALGKLRPLSAGAGTQIPTWGRTWTSVRAQVFEETYGPSVPRLPNGDLLRWDQLVERHPDWRMFRPAPEVGQTALAASAAVLNPPALSLAI
ncbi:MAG TPA: hypothetical protein VHE78_11315 [Gemmatimonadaceae bacterium]|nr:hypothetical protein [Gemmatimonadaceae bacterium]